MAEIIRAWSDTEYWTTSKVRDSLPTPDEFNLSYMFQDREIDVESEEDFDAMQ